MEGTRGEKRKRGGIMKKIEGFAPDYDEEQIIKSLFGHTDENDL